MDKSRRDFIRTAGAGGLGIGLWPILTRIGVENLLDAGTAGGLPRASPESQGVSSKGIRRFIAAAKDSGLAWHSFMLVRHGHVVAEGWWKPYTPAFTHSLFSLSKSFTSTAIGLLVKEGKLDIDAPVLSFFPEDSPPAPDENLKRMKVRHLLTMTTGLAEDTLPKFWTADKAWTKVFLEQPVSFEPGTHFVYNTGATYMLGAIVYKITGQTLEKYLAPRLFQPLEIRDYDWQTSPQGLSTAGYGLRVKTEDIAKFGQLYLQKGKWHGKEILPENWVNAATQTQTPSQSQNGEDWLQGYGFQFWRGRHGTYRGDGYFGQYCLVMPELDAVLAVTGEIPGMQKALNTIWDHLLPAMQADRLAESEGDLLALKSDLIGLELPVTRGAIQSPMAPTYHGRKFVPDQNNFGASYLQFKFSTAACELIAGINNEERTLRFGWEKWLLNTDSRPYLFDRSLLFPVPSKLAGTATWLNENTLQLDARLVETMMGDKITCTFQGDKLSVSFLNSIAEKTNGEDAPEKRMPLTGTVIPSSGS